MAIVGTNELTIVDAAKRVGPDGKVLDIAELLHQKTGIVKDVPWRMGNTNGGNISVGETSLPTIATRVAGSGVANSKRTTAQWIESPEVLEGVSVVDEVVGNYGYDVAAKRAQEANGFAESMNQTVADRFIYGNGSTTVGQTNGLAVRYASTSATNGSSIIKAGGAGADNMSIWLVGWGPVYGWYPKGSPGGLKVEDMGKVSQLESDGSHRIVWKTHYQWSMGIGLDDWRYVIRIANIDKSDLVANSGSQADLPKFMIFALNAIPDLGACRPVFYMNRTTRMMLEVQLRADVRTGGQLNYSVVDGKRVADFQGIRIETLDRLTEAEAVIS